MRLKVDNVIKKEWDEAGFLMTKNKIFVLATKKYETVKGVVSVFFTSHTAFVWADDAGTDEEDLWSQEDMIPWLKKNRDGSFPTQYNEYVPIISYGADVCDSAMLERYGLTDFEEDIIARLKDVEPYSEEKDTKI